MQIQLDDLIQRMEDVKEFINVEYQLYPSASGTLFAGSMGGVPHGSSFQLYFVRNNGTKLDIHQSSSRLYGWVSLFRPLSGHRTG